MTVSASVPFNRRQSVGEIAAALPGATAVFRRFGLDFCCKGDVPLEDSARLRGVALGEVEQALSMLDTRAAATAPRETAALIAHILARYHEVHRRELPELVALARRVEAVHAKYSEVPHGLADLLERLQRELESHMRKEELILFPAMARTEATDGGLEAPISCMRHEHDDHGANLHELEALTNGFTLPAGACRTWRALYAGGAKLVADVMEHIHLENNLLFPRFAPPPRIQTARRRFG
ncbi:MAG: iron-sulfur cluster repair di-iron protein [Reyranella sp.]|nr:iron-sulfur cluster repair di-iron protein [Reyranella sp.]